MSTIIGPIIVEGVPRSGTRFFCKFIASQYNIFIFRIQRIIKKYYNKIDSYGDLHINQNLHKFLVEFSNELIFKERLGSFDVDNFIKTSHSRDLSGILSEILSTKSKENGFRYWGLKFDNPSGMIICNHLFPDSKFIHIIRDGRDVHLSACKCLSEGYYTPYNNAKFWKRLVEERRNLGREMSPGRYLEIKYENLLSDPLNTSDIIAEFLNIYKHRYKYIDIKKTNYNKWKNKLKKNEIKVYESISGDLLNEIGYETYFKEPNISKFLMYYYKAIETPLKINKYVTMFLKGNKRYRVIRRIKLKISDLL